GVENRLHSEVCAGALSLAAAQHQILYWVNNAPPSTGSPPAPSPSAASTRNAGRVCTPGYSPCIPPGSDVDCAGGGGDGPRYVQGPVRVTGSDPYDLDGNGDGVGCE